MGTNENALQKYVNSIFVKTDKNYGGTDFRTQSLLVIAEIFANCLENLQKQNPFLPNEVVANSCARKLQEAGIMESGPATPADIKKNNLVCEANAVVNALKEQEGVSEQDALEKLTLCKRAPYYTATIKSCQGYIARCIESGTTPDTAGRRFVECITANRVGGVGDILDEERSR